MKVAIVFEEGKNEDGGVSFKVYIDGISKTRRVTIDSMSQQEQQDELSTAEYWGLRCFQIVAGVLNRSGAVQRIERSGDGS